MRGLIYSAAMLFCAAPAFAQQGGGVVQSGSVTAGDCVSWKSTNIIQDAGAACGGGSSALPVASLPRQTKTHGDSITYGTGASATQYAYGTNNGLLFNDLQTALTDRGIAGNMVADVANGDVFPLENPGNTPDTLHTLMIGTNDQGKGPTYGPAVYNPVMQAVISWLTVPRASKVFGQDAGCVQTSGTWANDNTYQTGIGIQSTTNGSVLTCTIRSYGNPIYLWYRVIDGNGGTFTYALDGGTPVAAANSTSVAIATNNGTTQAVALARITGVSSGSHTITITVTSTTGVGNIVGITAIGSPATAVAGGLPMIVSGIIYQQNDANSAETALFNGYAQSNAQTMISDGLPVVFSNVRAFINSTTDMADNLHPNDSGHNKIRMAFESVLPTGRSPLWVDAGATSLVAGRTTLNSNRVTNTVAIGNNAAAAAQGATDVTMIGNVAGQSATTNYLTGFGSQALSLCTTCTTSTAVGYRALASTLTGIDNTAIGHQALSAATASESTAVGYQAANALTSGGYVTAIGTKALAAVTGSFNTAVGYNTGPSLVAGTSNVFLGYQAGTTCASGSSNIIIGVNSACKAAANSNMINIGGLIYYNVNSAAAPAVTSCGTSPSIDANANNKSGTVTIGTGSPASCTVTFAGTGYSSWNHCRVTAQTGGLVNFGYGYTLTVLTITSTALSGKVDYDCDGY